MLFVTCFAVIVMTDDITSSEWLIIHWGNHDCPSGRVGQTQWNLSGVERSLATARHSGMQLVCLTYYVNYVLCTCILHLSPFLSSLWSVYFPEFFFSIWIWIMYNCNPIMVKYSHSSFTCHVITYPCWDLSQYTLVKDPLYTAFKAQWAMDSVSNTPC